MPVYDPAKGYEATHEISRSRTPRVRSLGTGRVLKARCGQVCMHTPEGQRWVRVASLVPTDLPGGPEGDAGQGQLEQADAADAAVVDASDTSDAFDTSDASEPSDASDASDASDGPGRKRGPPRARSGRSACLLATSAAALVVVLCIACTYAAAYEESMTAAASGTFEGSFWSREDAAWAREGWASLQGYLYPPGRTGRTSVEWALAAVVQEARRMQHHLGAAVLRRIRQAQPVQPNHRMAAENGPWIWPQDL